MGASEEAIIRKYQYSLEKYFKYENEEKIYYYLTKVDKVPMSLKILENTGIGKTVNASRKFGGRIADYAKTIIRRWKDIVCQDAEEAEPTSDYSSEECDGDKRSSNEDNDDEDEDALKIDDEPEETNSQNVSEEEEETYHSSKKSRHSPEVDNSSHKYKSRSSTESHSKRKYDSDCENAKVEKKQKTEHSKHGESKSKKHKEEKEDRHKKSEKDKYKIEKEKDRHRKDEKSYAKSSSSYDDNNRSSSSKSSSEHKRKSSSDKDKSHSKENNEKVDKTEKKQKSSDRDEKRESSSSKDKHSNNSKSKNKEDSHKSKSSSSSEKADRKRDSSSHKSKDHEKSSKSKSDKSKKEKSSKKLATENGISCDSGASFAEALGMIAPVSSPSKSKKRSQTSSPVTSSSSTSKLDKVVPVPTKKLEPLDINLSSLLPTITPNYRPLGIDLMMQPKQRSMTDEETLSVVISSKKERTKVYSGIKNVGKVSSLFELCVRVLQDNIDALEYTGGVPYDILKPILEKATTDQLFTLEHHNPYLMDDTDELWEYHCTKDFRNKKREELESFREMYMRCTDEREARLKALTANIKLSQDKSTPVRQTKLAYVDSVAKPPRNIAKRQAKNGISNKVPTITPASRLSAKASSQGISKSNAVPVSAPSRATSSNAIKPKKAPLMQKTLAFMKGRFGRK